ncbi:MAG: ImmA/IrrE family metallo-endopeptidase [Clostridiales bacterium]|nr:ImmA/IrrE family metallo-endopeptidase [Clostridiales bacterium]
MTLEEIKLYAEESGAEISDVPLPDMDAFCFPEGWIAIDRSRMETPAREKVVTTHELGHINTGSFYSVITKCDIKEKHEYRADKWAAHKLMPFSEIQEALRSGVRNDWEMAEFFGVTEKFVARAMDIYQREGLLAWT